MQVSRQFSRIHFGCNAPCCLWSQIAFNTTRGLHPPLASGRRLKLAAGVPVQAALREFHFRAEHFAEHVFFQFANRRVGIGQIQVGTIVLPEDRQLAGAIHFHMKTPVRQRLAQLPKPLAQGLGLNKMSVPANQRFPNPLENQVPDGGISICRSSRQRMSARSE